jgi:hypothetical protein
LEKAAVGAAFCSSGASPVDLRQISVVPIRSDPNFAASRIVLISPAAQRGARGRTTMMKLVGQMSIANQSSGAINIPGVDTAGFEHVKIVGAFEVNAQGVDAGRLLIQPNGIGAGYRGFTNANGDYGAGEWENGSGLYIGRVGWGQNGTLSFEADLSVVQGGQECTMYSTCTWAYGNNNIIGWRSHAHVGLQGWITSVTIVQAHGLIRGDARVYLL